MKKGFTLIELLAVIVVIAIITLISIPIIANVIETSKKGSAVDSAYGFVDALEKNIALGKLDSNKGIIVPINGTISSAVPDESEKIDGISLKGKRPEYATLTFEKSKVVSAGFCIDGYNVKYENKKAKILANATGAEDYCKNTLVKEIRITNAEEIGLEWSSNNPNVGNMIAKAGGNAELEIEVITKDGSVPDDLRVYESSDPDDVIDIEEHTIIPKKIGSATVLVTSGIKYKKIVVDIVNDSILGYLQVHDFGATGETEEITITANNTEYKAHVYNYEGDQEWTIDNIAAIANQETYVGFGNASDVATNNSDVDTNGAKRMVIIKVNGNLTIDSGVTIKPYAHLSYGGPKGFLIYVTGTLTNNGTIANSRGAFARGQDVYLWQNGTYEDDDHKYEYVPAAGAAGIAKWKCPGNGKNGNAGTGRKTGGGGTGSGSSIAVSYVGASGAGTSYSGGSGSGATYGCNNGDGTSGVGAAYGGAGGAGFSDGCQKVGGAGNPGGNGYSSGTGTGGLLIIYANKVTNGSAGKIAANGAVGGYTKNASTDKKIGGGGSGGGSINIFYEESFVNNNTASGAIAAAAGGRANSASPGGYGGAGTVTIGSINGGTFTPYSE